MTILCYIAGVTRRDRRRNVDIRKELVINHDVVELVRQRRLRYFGHVVRMMPCRTPSLHLYGRVECRRPVGRPRKPAHWPPWLDVVGWMWLERTESTSVSRYRRQISWPRTGCWGVVRSIGCLSAMTRQVSHIGKGQS